MSEPPTSPTVLYRLDGYELDLQAGELRHHGVRVNVQDLPLRLLGILAAHAGHVVRREELQRRLWPDKTFADFEDGLNTAIRKLRQALDDDPREPKWIETIRGYGYRLRMPVEVVERPAPLVRSTAPAGDDERGTLADTGTAEASAATPPPPAPSTPPPPEARRRSWQTVAGIAALAALVAALWWITPEPPPTVETVFPITTSGRLDYCMRSATDGGRLFYLERHGDKWQLMQTSVSGGESQPAATPASFPNTAIFDVSPDGTQLLAGSFERKGDLMPLYTLPVQGGPEARLSNLVAQDAAWSHRGDRLVFSRDHDLFVAKSDGTDSHRIATIPDGPMWPGWSPDDRTIRFTTWAINDETRLWEIGADGRGLREVLPHWSHPASERFGSWSGDGDYYFFTSGHAGHQDVWALRERCDAWWRRCPAGPYRLTDGPLSVVGATGSREGHRVYYCGDRATADLEEFDPATNRIAPFRPEINPLMPAFSADGAWMVYAQPPTYPRQLWRSRLDGTDRLRLVATPMGFGFPRWSPDGKRIAFTGLEDGKSNLVYLVDRDGGKPEPLVPDWVDVRDPDWSPDGASIVVTHVVNPAVSKNVYALAIVDVASRRARDLPDSSDVYLPRWSPDGRFISATADQAIRLFDRRANTWRVVAQGKGMTITAWSRDGAYLYFQDGLSPGEPVFRARAEGGAPERVADFTPLLQENVTQCSLFGLAPNGHLLVGVKRTASDLYAVELR